MLFLIKQHFFTPFLLTVYPVVFLYSRNLHRAEPRGLPLALVVTLLMTGLVFGVVRLIFKQQQRAIFMTSIFVLLFYTYGHVVQLGATFETRLPVPLHNTTLMSMLWLMLLLTAVYAAFKWENKLESANHYLTLVAMFLLIMQGIMLLTAQINRAQAGDVTQISYALDDYGIDPTQIDTSLPDIYHIVLDAYTREDILRDYLGYDNSAFINALRDRDFFVADNARSNYIATFLSLASMLNMQYVDFLEGTAPSDQSLAFQLLDDNLVINLLEQLGYQTIQFSSGWGPTEYNDHVDRNINRLTDEPVTIAGFDFNINLSVIHLLLIESTWLKQFTSPFQYSRHITAQYNFAHLPAIADNPEPTYTLMHIIAPHAPYYLSADDAPAPVGVNVDGEIIDQEKAARQPGYIDQIIFANRAVTNAIDAILENSDTPPIIIIHGDHGLRHICVDLRCESQSWFYDFFTPTLSAFYLPDGGGAAFYPSITHVNVYRAIFNHYFDADMPLLEDAGFFPDSYIGSATNHYVFNKVLYNDVAASRTRGDNSDEVYDMLWVCLTPRDQQRLGIDNAAVLTGPRPECRYQHLALE